MEFLLEEQQKALQHALDLHTAMERYISTQEKSVILEPAASKASTAGWFPISYIARDQETSRSARSARRKATEPQQLASHQPSIQWQKLRQPLLQSDESMPSSIDDDASQNECGSVAADEPCQRAENRRMSLAQKMSQKVHRVFTHTKLGQVVRGITKEFETLRQVEENLSKHNFNVEDLYKQHGFWAVWRNNDYWQAFIFVTILANTVYIALDTDYNKADILSDAPFVFQVASNIFCSIFFADIVVRFCALKEARFFRHDGWLLFDSILVLLLLWETWFLVWLSQLSAGRFGGGNGVGCFSILRLFRVFRLIRTLHAVPELMVLISGMLQAMRSVLATLCLLVLTIYLFAILFTQLLAGTDLGAGCFDTVPQSMQFLLVQVLCGADADFMMKVHDSGNAIHYCLWLMFLFLGQLTIMNMLIGVVCNAIDETTEEIYDAVLQKNVARQIRDALSQKGIHQEGYISKDKFEILMNDSDFTSMLYTSGIDFNGMQEFFNFTYLGVNDLAFNDVLDMVIQFRQEKATTVQDLLVLRRVLHLEIAELEDRLRNDEAFSRQSSVH